MSTKRKLNPGSCKSWSISVCDDISQLKMFKEPKSKLHFGDMNEYAMRFMILGVTLKFCCAV